MRHIRLLALLATQLLTHAALATPPPQPAGQVPGSLISQARVSTGMDYTTGLYKPLSLDPWGVTRTVPTDGAGNNCGSGSPLPCPQASGPGSGGSSNTAPATSPGTSASTANPVQGVNGGVPMPVQVPGAGAGTDASSAPPTALTALKSGSVVNPGQLYVQNQSGTTVQITLGTTGNKTTVLVAPGAGANQQGGDWSAAVSMPWFTGPYTINGATGAQVAVRAN